MGWLLRSGFKGRLKPIPGPVMGHGEEISQRNKNGWHGEEEGDKKRCWERKPSTGTRDFSLRTCSPLCSAEKGKFLEKDVSPGLGHVACFPEVQGLTQPSCLSPLSPNRSRNKQSQCGSTHLTTGWRNWLFIALITYRQ